MHPDLLNNSLFLRYYKQWQDDPESVVFAPIAEFFLHYNMVGEAFEVCKHGIKRHPNLVSGLIVMAKVQMERGNWEEADALLRRALAIAPLNGGAKSLLEEAARLRKTEEKRAVEPSSKMGGSGFEEQGEGEETAEGVPPGSWSTLTMAKIYKAQGHLDRARQICEAILSRDPQNADALKELGAISNVQ